MLLNQFPQKTGVVLPGPTGQGSGAQAAGQAGEASETSGLAQLLQQVSEILAGQMQPGDHPALHETRAKGVPCYHVVLRDVADPKKLG